MGIKKLFKIKPPEEDTLEQNRETLNEMGISTRNPSKKKREKFAAYGRFAKDKAQDRVYAPEGYENFTKPQEEDDLNKSELDNATPNAESKGGGPQSADPYAASAGGSDPYAINTSANYGADPYSNMPTNNYQGTGYSENSYTSSGPSYGDPYQAPNGYSSAYSGINGAGNVTSPYGASGSNMQDQNRPKVNPYGGNFRDNSYSDRSSSRTANTTSNPYGGLNKEQDEYSRSGSFPKSSKQPANPYATLGTDVYASHGVQAGQDSQSKNNPYSRRNVNEYGSATGNEMRTGGAPRRRMGRPDMSTNRLTSTKSAADTLDLNKSAVDGDDLNEEPRAGEFDFEEERPSYGENTVGVDELDLNAPLNEQDQQNDFNSTIADHQEQLYQEAPQWQLEDEGLSQSEYTQHNQGAYKTFDELQREEEARQQQEEDEAVDEVKQEIRFTKQSSVASTRNTLKMAQEAEMSGMNSIGLLGHQSERLNNIEGNLDLMKVQNKIADDKVAELKKLNRNILAVHVSNPFNSKRRQREREEKIKNRKIEEKLMKEHTSQQLARSTQRIEGAMNANDDINTVREKYQRKQILDRSKQFQFENDEEDDMMEVEIDRNLDQIQQISGRLKKLAMATGEELDSQQKRVRNIEDNTDDLDIKIHLNTTRLSGIR